MNQLDEGDFERIWLARGSSVPELIAARVKSKLTKTNVIVDDPVTQRRWSFMSGRITQSHPAWDLVNWGTYACQSER